MSLKDQIKITEGVIPVRRPPWTSLSTKRVVHVRCLVAVNSEKEMQEVIRVTVYRPMSKNSSSVYATVHISFPYRNQEWVIGYDKANWCAGDAITRAFEEVGIYIGDYMHGQSPDRLNAVLYTLGDLFGYTTMKVINPV